MLLEHNLPVYDKLEETMENNGKALVVTTTGTGKSYLGLEYVQQHNLKTLVVVPKVVIGNAWEALSPQFKSMTYHSFVKLKERPDADLVIFDEAHHCGATTWESKIKNIIDTYQIPYIGLTADSKRWSDGARDVSDIFWDDSLVEGYTLKDAIQSGILPHIKYVSAFYDLGSFKERYSSKNLTAPLLAKFNYAIDNCKKISEILEENLTIPKIKGIIFVDSISQIPKAYKLFSDMYPDIPIWSVSSNKSQKLNDQAISEYDTAEQGFMISVDMFNEGLHLSGVNTIIMLRRTTSPNIFFQQIGRAMSVGKLSNDPVVFDFVGNNIQLKSTSYITRRRSIIIDTLKELFSDQVIITDYTKDIIDVIRDIDNYLDNSWTKEEDDIIRKYYPTEGAIKCSNRFENRTSDAVRTRARVIGVASSVNYWTPEEDEILRKYYPTEGQNVQKRIPKKAVGSCFKRAQALGIAYGDFWTPEDDEILRKYYPIEGRKSYVRFKNHSEQGVKSRANKLKIKFIGKLYNEWTPEEDEIIRKYYPTEGQLVYKRLSNRTEKSCVSRASTLKVKSKNNVTAWTKEEEDIIRKWYSIEGLECINRLPNRTLSSIASKASKMKIFSRKIKGDKNV